MIEALKPKCELLGREFIVKIIDEALGVLENTGVFVENAEARELLQAEGMRIDETQQRVCIDPSLVERSLKTTPPEIKLFDRSGQQKFLVGGDEFHFAPGSAAVTLLDHGSRKQRKPDTSEVASFVRLIQELEHIHFQSTGMISGDVPEIIADGYRLYLGLMFSTKPIVTGTFRIEGFQPMRDMLAAVRGGTRELAEKPLAIFDACPSPALKWSNLTTQSLIDCARAGIPSELISMGMTGATSPITLAGTLVQHVAENLSGLVICQLARSGAPVIFGGSPSSFDMRKGTTPMGAIETMMIDSAYAQIAKHLHLPCHAYMGLSDSKCNDSQAGLETGIGAVLAALSGINVISGPGMLDFESCQSLEKLVIDNEICGMAYRLCAGIEQRDEPLTAGLFENFTAESQFLSQPHTRKWYRQEHLFSHIIDRDVYDAWVLEGEKTMADRAADRTRAILNAKPVETIDPKLAGELRRIMSADAAQNDAASLPELPLNP